MSVGCSRQDGQGILTQDDGIGMVEGTGEQTMGLKLIRTLAKGIGAELRIDNAEGTRIQVTFPL